MKIHGVSRKTPYFSDCKMHFYPPKFGRKMGVHHIVQMQLAWLAAGSGVGGENGSGAGGFFYFPPLKPRCILWSSASYSLKNTVLSY